MNISKSWLEQYVPIHCDVETLCDKLTMAGIEVEAVDNAPRVPAGVVVAKILERNPHPGSDHLSVCQVFDGKEKVQIVCGAPNCDAGKTVPLATIGTVFKTPEGEFKIKKSKLRGVESFGMMCSGAELGLNNDDDGLMIMDDALEAGTPLDAVFPGECRIEVEVTPNRPDWLSHWGVARDVACLLNEEAKLPELNVPALEPAPANLVTVEDKELCPRYIGRLIRGVKVAESPDWLKERLTSVGLRPINNVVDITNFILMELGQPMHAFDADLLAKKRVVARRAKAGETIVTLDGSKLELNENHLVIADAEKPMALAGVMGGEFSGVTEKTVNILLESAVFNSSNIRATSRKLGISSDSSYRYERGVDYDMADYASDRAAQLIMELAGGEALSEKVEVTAGRPEEKVILCRFDRIRGLIGFDCSNDEMVAIFRRLRLQVEDITETSCKVTAPLFRLDLEREADLAEEVARVHGLDKIPVLPVSATVVDSIRDDAYIQLENLRNELIGFGLDECMHYSMVSERSALSDTRFTKEDMIALDNPLSSELALMRPSLYGEMLGSVERNIARRNLDLRLFEVGRVFCGNDKLYPEERLECCIVLTGCRYPERYSGERDLAYDFFDLKGLLECWLEKRRVKTFNFKPAEDGRFAPGTAAAIEVNGKVIGAMGQVAPALTKGWRTTMPVWAAVIEVDPLFRAKTRNEQMTALSQYPAVSRDVAFLAPQELRHGEVVEFIRRSGLPNLESVRIFDIFEDEKTLGKGVKSMAYGLTFRHAERTLRDDEVNNAVEKLRKKLADDLHVTLR